MTNGSYTPSHALPSTARKMKASISKCHTTVQDRSDITEEVIEKVPLYDILLPGIYGQTAFMRPLRCMQVVWRIREPMKHSPYLNLGCDKKEPGHSVLDLGCHSADSSTFPGEQ